MGSSVLGRLQGTPALKEASSPSCFSPAASVLSLATSASVPMPFPSSGRTVLGFRPGPHSLVSSPLSHGDMGLCSLCSCTLRSPDSMGPHLPVSSLSYSHFISLIVSPLLMVKHLTEVSRNHSLSQHPKNQSSFPLAAFQFLSIAFPPWPVLTSARLCYSCLAECCSFCSSS